MSTQPPKSLAIEPRRRDRSSIRSAAAIVGPLTTAPEANAAVDLVDPNVARKVLDLAMRVAEYLLAAGAAANDVVVSVLRLTDSYGLRTVHVDVTNTSVQVSYYRGFDRDPLMNMRVVQSRSVDFTAHERIQALLRQIELGEGLSIDEATTQFRAIIRAAHPYRPWLVTSGNAGVAVGIVLLFGGGLLPCLITFVITWGVDRLLAFLGRRHVPPFIAQGISAFGIMIGAGGVFWLGTAGLIPAFALFPADLIVAGGIVMLVAGMTVVGAAQDAIDGFYVTASARAFETLLMTAGIVVGILTGLIFLQIVGVNVPVTTNPIPLAGSLIQQILAAALTAGTYAVSTHAGPRAVLLSFLMGAIGWTALLVCAEGLATLGVPSAAASVAANGAAALVAAICTIPIATRWRTPALVGISSALIPLVPGIMMYRGLIQMVGTAEVPATPEVGAMTLFTALGIALAISGGVTFGTHMGRPLNEQLRRISGLTPLARRRLRLRAEPSKPTRRPTAEEMDQP